MVGSLKERQSTLGPVAKFVSAGETGVLSMEITRMRDRCSRLGALSDSYSNGTLTGDHTRRLWKSISKGSGVGQSFG